MTDGFRGRAAAVLVAGDPSSGNYAQIDSTGITVYANGTLVGRWANNNGGDNLGVLNTLHCWTDDFAITAAGPVEPSPVNAFEMQWGLAGLGVDAVLAAVKDAFRFFAIATNYDPVDIQNGSTYHLPWGLVATPAQSTSVLAASTGTELKDTGIGDRTFTAVAGRRYRFRYAARAQSTVASDTIDFRIRDGGASSPTNASTALTGASICVGAVAGGAGASQLIADAWVTGLSAGTHTVAPFYIRTAGSGNCIATQSAAGQRQLTVEDIGV